MDAGPDALHRPLGAGPVDPDLGRISPELALVDPELAQRLREQLPEPQARPRRPAPPPEPAAPEPAAQPEAHRRRRRWPRAVALAIVIFAAGAVSGSLLGNHQTGSPAKLEVPAALPIATGTSAALRPPSVVRVQKTTSTAPRRQRRRQAHVVWAANVLGVEATVSRRGVALRWQRPADSTKVVVLRKRGSSSVVVYRGRATSYQDASPRSCTGYRYTIVNYDRSGHRSTGVPTSVVTLCG